MIILHYYTFQEYFDVSGLTVDVYCFFLNSINFKLAKLYKRSILWI